MSKKVACLAKGSRQIRETNSTVRGKPMGATFDVSHLVYQYYDDRIVSEL